MSQPTKIILITGGYRTGSTLVFNLVREIMEATGVAGRPITLGASGDEVDRLLALPVRFLRDWYLVKCHNYVNSLNVGGDHVKVIHTMRQREAARDSLARIRGVSPIDPSVVRAMNEADTANWYYEAGEGPVPALLFEFEELFEVGVVLQQIADFLGADLRDESAKQMAERWHVAQVAKRAAALTEADPVTELRPGHITSPIPVDSSPSSPA